jgi:type II secretory pathway predicted ATPase ExeA
VYQDYFGLNSKPFGIVPDTRFLFLSDKHKEAIAHLVYALNEKNGFVQLTGEVGVGKTMACRYILANIPQDIDVALILNPRIDEIGLLRTLCQELDIPFDNTQKANELTQLLNSKLLAAHASGRHTILIIDEAQNLPKRTLEQLRLLTNLETDTQKLLRIILIGQPELGQMLSAHDMRQVAQRITSRYHLTTLSAEETDQYIHHRLSVAGCHQALFKKAATRKIHKLTKGTPRLINLLCDHALIGAYSLNAHEVTPSTVKKAAKEALPNTQYEATKPRSKLIPALLILLFLLASFVALRPDIRHSLNQYWLSAYRDIKAVAEIPASPATNPEMVTTDGLELEKVGLSSDAVDTKSEPAMPAAASMPNLSPEKLEAMKKEADVDFRLGIPAGGEG